MKKKKNRDKSKEIEIIPLLPGEGCEISKVARIPAATQQQ
jgi:hypothetical protein